MATKMAKNTDQAIAKPKPRRSDMVDILDRVKDWAGGETQALTWYRSQPVPALGGCTPEALVKDGNAGAVHSYLDHIARGGFA